MAHHSFPEYLDNVWIYLRKSREDREAEERARREGRDEIETLARHRRKLFQLAHQHHWNVTRVFEEVVSGEYISERPEIQNLLAGVEHGEAHAVLAIDIDRLGRGDMEDQGRILRTFREASTLILTPDKVYDLTDEMDEEWTEFKAFFARRELKMITKRMQRGRIASINEGKYIGTRPPFGYDINRELVLVPNKDADTVRMIFDLYVNHGMGGGQIANYLNSLGIPTAQGKLWRAANVIQIIRNEHYAGYVTWRKIKYDKRRSTHVKRPDDEVIRAKGQHEPIIDIKTFEKSAHIRSARAHHPVGYQLGISNPLASLVECAQCGEKLIKRPYGRQRPHLMCKNPNCQQRSTRLDIVEERILAAMREWLSDYELTMDEITFTMSSSQKKVFDKSKLLEQVDQAIEQIAKQRDNLHNLLERGTYDDETFSTRNKKLVEELAALRERKHIIQSEIEREHTVDQARYDIIPRVTHVLDAYKKTCSAKDQNSLLRSVLHKVVYNKETWQRGDQFELALYPVL
jgi:DNA invertase Pin-like site-specific DNA recombinase